MNEAQALTLEAGKYYRTRDGKKAFVAAIIDNPFSEEYENSMYPIKGFIENTPTVFRGWGRDGIWCQGDTNERDLVAEWVEPKRVKGWLNVYDAGSCSEHAGGIHPTKQEANDFAMDHRLACIEIDVEEGHGLGEAA